MYIDAGSKDLLTLMGVTSLPLGVRRARDRQSAYVVDHTSSINAPLSKVVRVFPAEFALLITARQRTTGFLFTVNDMLGCVQLSEFFFAPPAGGYFSRKPNCNTLSVSKKK